MERHWIRVAATAVIVAGTSAPQATAQLAPYRLAQQQSAVSAPRTQASPQAGAPVATQPLYAPYRPQVPQQPAAMTTGRPIARVAAAPQYPRVANNYAQVQPTYPTVTYPQTAANYPTTPDYPQTTATYPQAAPTYPETTSTYPQSTPPYPESPQAYVPAATQYAQSPVPYTPGATPYAPYATYANTQQAEELPDNGDDNSLPPPSRNSEPMNGGSANGYSGNGYGSANGYGVDSGNGASANGVQSNGAANGTANGHSMLNSNGATTHVENGHNGYPATSYPYGYGDVGANCNEHDDWGLGSYFDNPHHDSNWFGGVYYLLMTRDNPDNRRLTAMFDTPAAGYPYYPAAEWTVLSTSHVDHDYRSGVEIRFGSTFAAGGHHDDWHSACGTPYGYGYGCDNSCNSCDGHEYAWEFGAWILDDDVNTAQVVDSIPTDTDRIYGMKNFAGLSYNGRDVNEWYDYQMPVTDPAAPGATDVRILAQRVRSSFRAQNVELNFLRLPLCGMDSCGMGYAADHCHGYGATDCAPSWGSGFSMATLCGVRYLRFDDDFEYATMWGTGTPLTPPAYTPWDGEGELFYDIEVDNELYGFQLGANMNYCISCRCNVFWNSSFGMYNNHIEVYQRVYGEFGPATWTQTGADAVISADKDDIAFAGEMLIGTSYNFTCNCRGVLAYRAVAVSGVGLSVDQIPENFANEADVALVESNGSLIIHGVQIGAEWRY